MYSKESERERKGDRKMDSQNHTARSDLSGAFYRPSRENLAPDVSCNGHRRYFECVLIRAL